MTFKKKLFSTLAIGAIGAATFSVGSALVKDVKFARAEQQVIESREKLSTLSDLASAFKSVGKSMEQSVVHIEVKKEIQIPVRRKVRPGAEPQSPFNPFDGLIPEGDTVEQATGSGVIMEAGDGEAYLVTNNHVAGGVSEMTVTLADGRKITDCKVIGTDPKSDLAVVKIKADHIIPAKWGDSGELEKGDIVLAFGSPFGLVGSMSHGIVSALDRQAGVIDSPFAYENFIQVDAPINPGNSGGPLVNLKGEVVGINTAIASESGGFQGIGFAIPSNQAKTIYASLKSSGKVTRGYLGVEIADVTSDADEVKAMLEQLKFKGDKGVLVVGITAGAPATDILKPSDIITEINDKPISTMSQLRNTIANMPPKTEVKMTVLRDNKSEKLTIKLGEQPEKKELAAALGRGQGQIGLALTDATADDLEAAELPKDTRGALVKEVKEGSPADVAGIKVGEVITRVGKTDIKSADDAIKALKGANLLRGIRVDVTSKEGQRMVVLKAGK